MSDEDGTRLSRSDLLYRLPEGLIAQEPLPGRSSSRLLIADRSRDTLTESTFDSLPDLLMPGDLLVMNDTRVFRARLRGTREDTGGRTEVFLLKETGANCWKVLLRPSRRARPGTRIGFEGGLSAHVEERIGGGSAVVSFHSDRGDTGELIRSLGEVPLPPYIRRPPGELDDERYQTVYASSTGAVAAPTAGLHFDDELLGELDHRGIRKTMITLHVGPGTFMPLRHEELDRNRLDPEWYRMPGDSLGLIREARETGDRIIAVGTTSVRVLETVDLRSGGSREGETDLFIFPPYRFRNVDCMITNFHLPGSSLLALVAAFMGLDFMRRAYSMAVESKFRFYSYGDAMLIL
jgi:S-adenosylmethionine:tRNA ribosyltransferase-isomerase